MLADANVRTHARVRVCVHACTHTHTVGHIESNNRDPGTHVLWNQQVRRCRKCWLARCPVSCLLCGYLASCVGMERKLRQQGQLCSTQCYAALPSTVVVFNFGNGVLGHNYSGQFCPWTQACFPERNHRPLHQSLWTLRGCRNRNVNWPWTFLNSTQTSWICSSSLSISYKSRTVVLRKLLALFLSARAAFMKTMYFSPILNRHGGYYTATSHSVCFYKVQKQKWWPAHKSVDTEGHKSVCLSVCLSSVTPNKACQNHCWNLRSMSCHSHIFLYLRWVSL